MQMCEMNNTFFQTKSDCYSSDKTTNELHILLYFLGWNTCYIRDKKHTQKHIIIYFFKMFKSIAFDVTHDVVHI